MPSLRDRTVPVRQTPSEDQRPKVRRAAAPKQEGASWARFVTNAGTYHRLKIVALPEGVDEKDDELTFAAVEANQSDILKFREGALVSSQEPVIGWLRHRMAKGRLAEVSEDIATLDLRCNLCEFTAKNTAAGQQALADHYRTAHADRGVEGDDA